MNSARAKNVLKRCKQFVTRKTNKPHLVKERDLNCLDVEFLNDDTDLFMEKLKSEDCSNSFRQSDDGASLLMPVAQQERCMEACQVLEGEYKKGLVTSVVPVGLRPSDAELAFDLVADKRFSDSNIKTIHPVKFARQYDLKFKDRIYENGYPGSGNVLLIHILEELNARKNPDYTFGVTEKFFVDQAYNAEAMMISNVPKMFSKFGEGSVRIQVTDLDVGWINFTNEKGHNFWFMSNVGSVYRANIWTTHEFPSDKTVKKFHDMEYKNFISVRHPYDIIVSNLNKILYGQRENIGALLDDLEWFKSLAENVLSYYKQYKKLEDYLNYVRYEDLLVKQHEEIIRIANILDHDINEEDAKAMWTKFGFNELQANHMWKPGSGKWKKYFDDRHVQILNSIGFPEILDFFGYEGGDADKKAVESSAAKDGNSTPADLNISVADLDYGMQFGKEIVFEPKSVISGIDERNGMEYFSTSKDLIDEYLNNDDFWKMYRSLN